MSSSGSDDGKMQEQQEPKQEPQAPLASAEDENRTPPPANDAGQAVAEQGRGEEPSQPLNAAQVSLVTHLNALVRYPAPLARHRQQIRRTVNALYTVARNQVERDPGHELARLETPALQELLMDILRTVRPHTNLVYRTHSPITDPAFFGLLLHEALRARPYPPWDQCAQIPEVAPQPSGNLLVTQAAASITGNTPMGTPPAYRQLVEILRGIQLFSRDAAFCSRALDRAVEELVRLHQQEVARGVALVDNSPLLMLRILHSVCQRASPPIQDPTLVSMVIEAAIPSHLNMIYIPPQRVYANWRQELNAAIVEDVLHPLYRYQGTFPAPANFPRAVQVLLSFARFHLSWVAPGNQGPGYPGPITLHALNHFMDAALHGQRNVTSQTVRSEALHEVAWRDVGVRFLQQGGLGLRNAGPIEQDQLTRYIALFEPNQPWYDTLQGLSTALMQLWTAYCETPFTHYDTSKRIARARQDASQRLLNVIRAVMQQPRWNPPSSQLTHFLELASHFGHLLGQGRIPPIILNEVLNDTEEVLGRRPTSARNRRHSAKF